MKRFLPRSVLVVASACAVGHRFVTGAGTFPGSRQRPGVAFSRPPHLPTTPQYLGSPDFNERADALETPLLTHRPRASRDAEDHHSDAPTDAPLQNDPRTDNRLDDCGDSETPQSAHRAGVSRNATHHHDAPADTPRKSDARRDSGCSDVTSADNGERGDTPANPSPPVTPLYHTVDEAAARLWELFSRSKKMRISEPCKVAIATALHRIAAENPAAASIPRWYIDGKSWEDAAKYVLYGAACWLHGVGEVSGTLQQSFVDRVADDAALLDSDAAAANASALVAFQHRFEFHPERIVLPMLRVADQIAVLTALYVGCKSSAGDRIRQEENVCDQHAVLTRLLKRLPFSPVSCFTESADPTHYTAAEAAAVLWEMFPWKAARCGYECRAALVAELHRIATKHPAAVLLPRWYIKGQSWEHAAKHVLYGAARWLHGAGFCASETAQQAYFNRVEADVRRADPAAAASNDAALAAFQQHFDFQPALIKLSAARSVVGRLSDADTSTLWGTVAKRVLVAVSWQAQKANAVTRPVQEFTMVYEGKAIGHSDNNCFLSQFTKKFILSDEVNVASLVPRSLEEFVEESGHRLDEFAVGESAPVTPKFLVTASTLHSMRDRTQVVTSEVLLPDGADNELMEFKNMSVEQCLILFGEAGCGKTLMSIVAAAKIGIPIYLHYEDLSPEPRNFEAELEKKAIDDRDTTKVGQPAEDHTQRDTHCELRLHKKLTELAPAISKASGRPAVIVIDEIGDKPMLCRALTSISLTKIEQTLMVPRVKLILVGTGCEVSAIANGSQPVRRRLLPVPATAGGDAVKAQIAVEFPMVYQLLEQPRCRWMMRVMGNGRVAASVCRYLREALASSKNNSRKSKEEVKESQNPVDSGALLSSVVLTRLPTAGAEAVLQSAVVQSLWAFKIANGLKHKGLNQMLELFRKAFAYVAGGSHQQVEGWDSQLVSRYGIMTDTACYIAESEWDKARSRKKNATDSDEAVSTMNAAQSRSLPVHPRTRHVLKEPVEDSAATEKYVLIEGKHPPPAHHVLVARADHRYQMSPAYCEMGLSLLGVVARPWSGEGCELLLADYALVSVLAAHSGVEVSEAAGGAPHTMAALGAACRSFARPATGSCDAVITIRDLEMTRTVDINKKFRDHIATYMTARRTSQRSPKAPLELSPADAPVPLPPTVSIAVNRPKAPFADIVLWRSWDERRMCVQVKRLTTNPLLVADALIELHKMGCVCFATTAAALIVIRRRTHNKKNETHSTPTSCDEKARKKKEAQEKKKARAQLAAAEVDAVTKEATEAWNRALGNAPRVARERPSVPVQPNAASDQEGSSAEEKNSEQKIIISHLDNEQLLERVVEQWRRRERARESVGAPEQLSEPLTVADGLRGQHSGGAAEPPSYVIAVISENPKKQRPHLERAFNYLEREGVTAEYYVMAVSDTNALAPVAFTPDGGKGDPLLDGLTTYYGSQLLLPAAHHVPEEGLGTEDRVKEKIKIMQGKKCTSQRKKQKK